MSLLHSPPNDITFCMESAYSPCKVGAKIVDVELVHIVLNTMSEFPMEKR